MERVRQTVLDTFDNEVPFEKLVEELRPERDPSRSPFFQTMLTVQSGDTAAMTLADVEVSRIKDIAWNTAKYDLTVFFDETEDAHIVGAEYNTDLFEAATITAMLGELVSVLEAVIKHPREPVNMLSSFMSSTAAAAGESTVELMRRLEALGLGFRLDFGRLKVDAPKGIIDAALKATIAAHRDNIIATLQSRSDDRGVGQIRRLKRDKKLPVSSSQRRFWFLDRMEPGQSQYNVGAVVRLLGSLDIDVMRRSFDDIVARHEALRTRINDDDSSPWNEIMQPPEVAVEIVDLQELPDNIRATEATLAAEQWLQRPFDLRRGPLARFLIVRLTPENHVVGLSAHHMMADGWSLAIIWDEICKIYGARVVGRTAELPPLAIQYVDYAAWEQGELQAGTLARKLGFWKKQLSGAPPLLELPTDRPRPATQSFRGTRLIRLLDQSLIEDLTRRGRSSSGDAVYGASRRLDDRAPSPLGSG